MTAEQYAALHEALGTGCHACEVNRTRAESVGAKDLRGIWAAKRDQIESAMVLLAEMYTEKETT